MSWLQKLKPSRIKKTEGGNKRNIPEGLWTKCNECEAVLYRPELEKSIWVCPKCGYHMRIGARKRLELFLDEGSFSEIAPDMKPTDRLKFRDLKKYRDRLNAAQKETGENDALIAMNGRLKGMPVVAASFDFMFMAGSMGTVVGERFVRAATAALNARVPLICFSTSGGARMQEALFSLMQMARTSAALAKLSEEGVPFVSVMCNPTTGGVSASLAMLGDINIGEPKALIGFAGPRVIEQTVRQTLPEGFQKSEFLLEHGTLDMIVDRRVMRGKISELLALLMRQPSLSVEQ